MEVLRKAVFRFKEKDNILDEIAKNVMLLTENRIQEDDILSEGFAKGNPISISKSEFNSVLKTALNSAGYVRTSDKISILSDKVVNQLLDNGYKVGVTNEAILLSK